MALEEFISIKVGYRIIIQGVFAECQCIAVGRNTGESAHKSSEVLAFESEAVCIYFWDTFECSTENILLGAIAI